jgi:NDP-sugar pyrophosphorylase family protein
MDRDRLTITLSKTILAKVDALIDGTKIRNRSHAIEYLITQSLSPKVTQAVILAGGKGVNMRPFTFEMPKSLFPVGGKPILEHIIEMLRTADIRNIILSIGHLGEKIQEHFGDGKKFGVNITYVVEKEEMGTGGALSLAKPLIMGDTFLTMHSDILVDLNLIDLIAFHYDQGTTSTIALTSVVDPSSFGEVVLHGAKVTQFVEKPEKGHQNSQLINCGLYVFEKEIFDYIPSQGSSRLEDIFPKLATARQLSGFMFEGHWVDVGSPASYEKAINEWRTKNQ